MIQALKETEPDALSPKEALDLLYRLKKMADKAGASELT
jgi:hypothetical protein